MRREIMKKWNEIVNIQIEEGKEHITRIKNIEKFYYKQVIETNNQLICLLKQEAKEALHDLLIVRVEFYNVYGQACDVDALWLSNEKVNVGDKVSLFDNSINSRGKYDGRVKTRYYVPVDDREFSTVACPYNKRKIWLAE